MKHLSYMAMQFKYGNMLCWLKKWICKKYLERIKNLELNYLSLIEDLKSTQKDLKDKIKAIMFLKQIIDNQKEEIENLKSRITELPEPKLEKKISNIRLRQILENYTGNAKIYLLDHTYYLPKKEDIMKLLKDTNVDKLKYISDFFDCDDFAIRLWGVTSQGKWASTTLGFACGNRHAFNIVILEDEKLYIIEPQNDKLIPIERAGRKYKPIWLVII